MKAQGGNEFSGYELRDSAEQSNSDKTEQLIAKRCKRKANMNDQLTLLAASTAGEWNHGQEILFSLPS